MAKIIDIEEFKRRKKPEESGSNPAQDNNSTMAVFANILCKDVPEGLKNFFKELTQEEESGKEK
jgi:hypothetical protein